MSKRERSIRQRLKSDFAHYASRCLKIRTKAGAVEPFVLNAAQRHIEAELARQLAESGRVRALVLKGRQQGCSTYVEGKTLMLVCGVSGAAGAFTWKLLALLGYVR